VPAGERAGYKLFAQTHNNGLELRQPIMFAEGADGRRLMFPMGMGGGLSSAEKLSVFLASVDGKGQAEDLRLAALYKGRRLYLHI
jgi:hypothetical protein